MLVTDIRSNGGQVDYGSLVQFLINPVFNNVTVSGSLTTSGPQTFTSITVSGDTILGNPGTEGNGINVNGTNYESVLKVSDIGNSNIAQMILHRHSTTFEPMIVSARSNSNTNAHAAVTAGQVCMSLYGTGWTGTSGYQIFGSIQFVASSAGAISATSAPGKVLIGTTPNGAIFPVTAITIDQDQSVACAGTITSGAVGGALGRIDLKGTTSGTATMTVDATATKLTLDKPLDIGANALTAGAISTTATSGSAFNATSATTGAIYGSYQNTSGLLQIGLESSVGGDIVGGSAAYSAAINAASVLNIGIGSVNKVSVSSTGLAVTGTLTASGTIKPTAATPNAYLSSDNSAGISTTITTATLVGKTITIKDGIITSFV